MDEVKKGLPKGVGVRDITKLIGNGLIELENCRVNGVQHSLGGIGEGANGKRGSRDIISGVVESLVHAIEGSCDGRIESLGC
jgi:hypothetical protein